MNATDRLTELEIRYAQLEHTTQELSDVVYRQQRELDSLSRAMAEMSIKLKAADPGLVDASVQERPPHY